MRFLRLIAFVPVQTVELSVDSFNTCDVIVRPGLQLTYAQECNVPVWDCLTVVRFWCTGSSPEFCLMKFCDWQLASVTKQGQGCVARLGFLYVDIGALVSLCSNECRV